MSHRRPETVSNILVVDGRIVAVVLALLVSELLVSTLDLVEIIVQVGNHGLVASHIDLRLRIRVVSYFVTRGLSPSLSGFGSRFGRRCRIIVLTFAILHCFNFPGIFK